MKTVAISEETWRKLKELKEKMNFQSFNELIEALIETWHLTSIKNELSKINMSYEFEEAKRFIDTVKQFSREQRRIEGS
ncbi:MAG: antitoxin VapB family protein [Desulfurococcaceae archaeon]